MFIPENEIHNVRSNKTRKYIEEVLSCYYNANYRASIVTLYTTVIFDCFNKLIILKELYNDNYAKTQLNAIETLQKNPNTPYSDVEKKIVEVIGGTGLMSHIEMEQINQLKAARNNAAHPVFKNDYDLINPTKEQTIAHIRNMFDGVFTKDVILSKNILDAFRSDICDFFDRQPDLEGYDVYLENKFYKRFNESTKKYVFTELWKYAFWFDGDLDCDKYRMLFTRTLTRFLDWDKELYIYHIKSDEKMYAKITFKPVKAIKQFKDFYKLGCASLFVLLENHPRLWEDIPEDVRVNIRNIRKSDGNICLYSEFTSENELHYLKSIEEYIIKNEIKEPCFNPTLIKIKYDKHKERFGGIIRKKIVDYYNRNTDSTAFTDDFDYINIIYSTIINYILPDFSEEELVYLLDSVNRYNYLKATTNAEFKEQVNQLIAEKGYSIKKEEYILL